MPRTRTNTLSQSRPELGATGQPTKNGGLTPEQVVVRKKVWWICPEGPDHEWEASLNNRTRGKGCPCCAGQKVSVTNSLASLNAEITAQWHPTKNGSLTPERVVAGSNKKAWWLCPKGSDHEWEASIGDRSASKGCPFCRGLKVSATNSLASLHAEIAAQWHPAMNGSPIHCHSAVWSGPPRALRSYQ